MNVYSASLKGDVRESNEDAHKIIMNKNNNNPDIKNINLYAVFDGHGGKFVSNYLADNLPKFFVNNIIEYPLTKRYITKVYDKLQENLIKTQQAIHTGSTGLVMINFKKNSEDYIHIINNGDCRAVLCRDNFAIPLTKDHKPHWPEEYTRITTLGGKIKFDGYDWRIGDLSVSRAFGDLDAVPYVTHRPDIYTYKLTKYDKFIILACDGLWDVLTNADVCNYILLNSYDKIPNINMNGGSTINPVIHQYNKLYSNRINKDVNIAQKLAEFAIKKGSTDNITVIVIFLD